MFDPSINAALTVDTVMNGALVGVNTGSNGVSLANYKGNVMVVLTCPPVIGSGAVNINARLYAHTNADQNVTTTLLHQFDLVTNGGPSVQRVSINPRATNQYVSVQGNVLGTNANAYPTVLVMGYSTPNS